MSADIPPVEFVSTVRDSGQRARRLSVAFGELLEGGAPMSRAAALARSCLSFLSAVRVRLVVAEDESE